MNAPLRHTRRAEHPVDPVFTRRWSSRAFAETPVAEADILALLEAARWAPSAGNGQPWRFAWALRGEPAFDAIAAALAPSNRVWAAKAGALLAIASKTTRETAEGKVVPAATHAFDTGAAWASLALQAEMTGLVAHAMGGFDPAAAAAGLGLPEGHALHAIVAIGHRGDPALLTEALAAREAPSQRRPLAEIAGRGRFPA